MHLEWIRTVGGGRPDGWEDMIAASARQPLLATTTQVDYFSHPTHTNTNINTVDDVQEIQLKNIQDMMAASAKPSLLAPTTNIPQVYHFSHPTQSNIVVRVEEI